MNPYRTRFLTWLLIATTSFLLVPLLYLAGTREILNLEEKKNLVFNINTAESYANFLLYKAGISGNPRKVIVGRDGWLFLGNDYGQLLRHSRARVTDHSQLARGIKWFTKRQTGITATGARLIQIVPPDKLSIYPEYAPPWLLLPEQNITDLFVKGSLQEGLNIVDMRPALIAAKKSDEQLYFKTDSHWNHLAGVMTYQHLIAQLHKLGMTEITPVADIDMSYAPEQAGGNSQLLKINGLLPEDMENGVVLGFPGLKQDICISNMDKITLIKVKTCESQPNTMFNLTQPLLVTNQNALNDLTVVWYRDSFGTAISSLMQNTFKTIWELPYHYYYFSNVNCFLREHKPDIVLFMSVERNLIARVMGDLPGQTPRAISDTCPDPGQIQ